MNDQNIRLMREILSAVSSPEIRAQVAEISVVSHQRSDVPETGGTLRRSVINVRFVGTVIVSLARRDHPEEGVSWSARGVAGEYTSAVWPLRAALEECYA